MAFGGVGLLLVTGLLVWGMASPSEVEQSWADYAFGGSVFGAVGCFIFRVAVWPAVVLRQGEVLVRNPSVDHLLVGGSPQLEHTELAGLAVRDGDVQVSVFALSSSMLDQLTGSRTTRRLRAALADRSVGEKPVSLRRDRTRVLRQALLFVVVGALLAVLVHLASGG